MNLSSFHPIGSKISFSVIAGSWKNVILYPKKVHFPCLKTTIHEITFEGFVTAPKYSCDSTINRKMTSYEALTSYDVLISHSDSRLDNFIRLLLNGPLESHWIRGLKLTSKLRAVQFWDYWKKNDNKIRTSYVSVKQYSVQSTLDQGSHLLTFG